MHTHTHTRGLNIEAEAEEGISERGKRKWRKQSRRRTRFRTVYDWWREEGEEGVRARDQARDVSSHNARVLIASLDTRPILVSMGLGVLIAYSITWTFTAGWSLVSNYRSRRHGGMRPGWKLILDRENRASFIFWKGKLTGLDGLPRVFEVRILESQGFYRGFIVPLRIAREERNSFAYFAYKFNLNWSRGEK